MTSTEHTHVRKIAKLSGVKKPKVPDDVPVPLLVAEAAIKQAVPADVLMDWTNGVGGAFVIVAPSAQWGEHLTTVVGDFNEEIVVVPRSEAKRKEEQSGMIGRALAAGQTVVAVTPSVDFLPKMLRTVAHGTFTIKVTPQLLAPVVKVVSSGRLPKAFVNLNVSVLDFDEICGLITTGSTATEIFDKFERAIAGKTRMARDKERLPKMDEATEFGDARLFAMDLKQDLADYKSGRIGFEHVDKGIVLHGPPGTGKTLYARSLGEYLGVPVVLSSMGELFANSSGYLDGVIKAQRDMFERARSQTPCILFIDELDAVPDLDRAGHNKDWWAPVVNDFLTLLDGATSGREGVIVVGATNRIHAIPSALLRPGRFERKVYMGPPNAEGVARILRHHLGDELAGYDLTEIAGRCAAKSLTSAVLMEKVRSAKRSARREKRSMVLQDLTSVIIPKDPRGYDERFRVACHEAGHALAAVLYADNFLVSVDIEPDESGNGGSTCFRSMNQADLNSDMVDSQLKILLAGRAAEIVMLGKASAGSGGGSDSDLSKATSLLAAAHLSFGLGAAPRWRCSPSEAVAMMMLDTSLREVIERELVTAADSVEADLYKHATPLRKIVVALMIERVLPAVRVHDIIAAAETANENFDNAH